MDIQMPEMDGIEATQRIRQEWPVERRPRIIAMTADALVGDRERYLAAGLDDYISKPVQIDQLVRALLDTRSIQERLQEIEVPKEENPTSAVDLSYLRDIIGNDFIVLSQLIDNFIHDLSLRFEQLKTMLAEDNYEQAERLAHNLRSSSANMGAQRLSNLFRKIELISQSGLPEETDSLLNMTDQEVNHVLTALHSERM
jgi:CheY-like chemotaxis protein